MKQSGLHPSKKTGKDLGVNMQPRAILGEYMQRASEGGCGKACRVEEPEKGTGHSTWNTRRSLGYTIHRQLRPPQSYPVLGRVPDTKYVYSRKLLLNHCRREPESERGEAGD